VTVPQEGSLLWKTLLKVLQAAMTMAPANLQAPQFLSR